MEKGVQTSSVECQKCASPIWNDALFCSQCGASINPETSESITVGDLKQFASGSLSEIKKNSREVLKSEFGQKLAAGAAVGAVIATAVPFVGWGAGAIIGAGLVAYKRLTK